jgi:hypothetical protein
MRRSERQRDRLPGSSSSCHKVVMPVCSCKLSFYISEVAATSQRPLSLRGDSLPMRITSSVNAGFPVLLGELGRENDGLDSLEVSSQVFSHF